ncbi:MAG: LuxR family transcriptional regulator, partial [Alphaproteobacteria bacterium]|nr:LuxR family transcriptional regulator [Alphaproteobacteria bacterium]
PAFTAYTAAELAGVKGMEADALARATTDNFFRLFAKARRTRPGDATEAASCG